MPAVIATANGIAAVCTPLSSVAEASVSAIPSAATTATTESSAPTPKPRSEPEASCAIPAVDTLSK